MKKTKIEWCDSTWNPVTGCYHGCSYCYARSIATRFAGFLPDENPDTFGFRRVGTLVELDGMQARQQKNGKIVPAYYPFGFTPTLHKYRLDEPQRWEKPQNIFVCSMADLFGDWVPDDWIEAVFDACENAPQHRYLFLTKNPIRYSQFGVYKDENLWYGTSITRETEMSRFNSLPADCNTFVSMEPILEDLEPEKHNILFRQANWIIIGAETGNGKKVIPHKEWIDKICELASENGVPVFMKESLLPIMGEQNMRREFPWTERTEDK